jgi:hypothetical protein
MQYRCLEKPCRRYTTPGGRPGRCKSDKPVMSSGDRVRKARAKKTPEQKALENERNNLRRQAKRRAQGVGPKPKRGPEAAGED